MSARELTYREMGLLAECSDGTVRFVLAGKPLNPRLARRFARVLRRPVDELFTDAGSSSEQIDDNQRAAG
jgi:hypothetical protein